MKDMLKDQVILVAGGTSGMGEATAKLYASEGATVVIGGTNPKKAEKVVKEIEEAGGKVTGWPVTADYIVTGNIISTNGKIHEAIAALLD